MRAYALLDPECLGRCSPQRFAQLGPVEVSKFGFLPENCRVQTCQENDATAIAHIVYSGSSSANRRYSDTVTLRRIGGEWKIFLPSNFGIKKR
jgi:hypothetical protein